MTKFDSASQPSGILTRLARNQEGNVIAILAAAVIPAIGLVGGAVDMSRLYLTQARLQGACDAGALLGRKAMGVGTWAAKNNAANTQALKMFDQNFQSGAYGSNSLSRTYRESAGNVVGTASVVVPMALMQILGQESKTITVRCQAELRVPNTDVMFVLDTTGSMDEVASGSTESKISGLRKAVRCFYEALAKQNIEEVSPAQCGETGDPTNTNTGAVTLRFGFVPYANNVNVGELLPSAYIADSWTYQSREASITSVPGKSAVDGAVIAVSSSTAVTSPPDDQNWVNTGANVVQNGKTFSWYRTNLTQTSCLAQPVPTTGVSTTTGNKRLIDQDPATPVEPQSSVTRRHEQDTLTATRTYRHFFSGSNDCILQVKKSNQSNSRVTTVTRVAISWRSNDIFNGWTYKPMTFNVSGLKTTTNGVRNTSIMLPLGDNGADVAVTWNGCIEERQTYRAPDTNFSNDWVTIPPEAFDMNIDMLPTSDAATQWGPMLTSAVWERYTVNTSGSGVKSRSNTRTVANVFVGKNDGVDMRVPASYCPSPSKKVEEWLPDDFSTYVGNLITDGSTTHDIGLLWGARIMSPTGIFASWNAPANKIVERHMVFMTDGETNVIEDSYSPYGIHWYDRRQTPAGAPPTGAQLIELVDARTAALCKAIKDKNITLWVVSYGIEGDATNNRLKLCATPGKFFQATTVASLVANFKAIAAEISALRLTE